MISSLPIDRLVRATDLSTSLAAALRASKASSKCVRVVREVMADGHGRIDQEIWLACRDEKGYVTSLDTVQHGRLALYEAGVLKLTDETRTTSNGMPSSVWVWSDEVDMAEMFDAVVSDPGWKEAFSKAKLGRNKAGLLDIDQAEEWLGALRKFATQAQKKGLKLDEQIVSLGRWLHLQARGVLPPEQKS